MTASLGSARALLVYALILPLALMMGYLLATPGEMGTWATVGIVLMIVSAPLILANHQAFLFLSWNMTASVFFLPGRPQVWFVAAFLSLSFSLVQRTLSKEMRFISVPSLVFPLVFIAFVVLMTAKMTGGFGFRIFGSENVGGRRYFTLLAAVAGFMAMCARPIPSNRANRYFGFFFLGGLVNALSSLVPLLGPEFYFLLYVFPFEGLGVMQTGFQTEIIRYFGLCIASLGVIFYLLGRYGVKDILGMRHPVRLLLLFSMIAIASGGGFRGELGLVLLTFAILFCLEGLLFTRYIGVVLSVVLLISAAVIPMAHKLPLSMQRTLSFLPLNLSPVARFDAQASTEWRLEMWKVLLPRVPENLWLGRGLGISSTDLELTAELAWRGKLSSQELAMLAGDFHNGLLSVLIPFGIWGLIGIVWFWAAALRALYFNFRYGDNAVKRINTFLFAIFIVRMLQFLIVYGSFYDDLALFTGITGLSVALNNGIRKPASAPVSAMALPPATVDAPVSLAPGFARASRPQIS